MTLLIMQFPPGHCPLVPVRLKHIRLRFTYNTLYFFKRKETLDNVIYYHLL